MKKASGNSGVIKNLHIKGIRVNRKSKSICVHAVSNELIPYDKLCRLETHFREKLSTERIELSVRFDTGMPLAESLDKYREGILAALARIVPISGGILAGCLWRMNDGRLEVSLVNGGVDMLEDRNCDAVLENLIEGFFGERVKVRFKSAGLDEDRRKEYIEFKNSEQEKAENGKTLQRHKSEHVESKKESASAGRPSQRIAVLKGKDFRDKTARIDSVSTDTGTVAVKGEVFFSEHRETKRKSVLIILKLTDYTSSLTVKSFLSGDRFDKCQNYLRKGNVLKVRGDIQYDSFSRDIVLMAKDIVRIRKDARTDNSPEKRVELHMHTGMSSMDGVSHVSDLIRTAAQWGHKAVAVTDHGVVQAFPDAYSAAKKHGIKVIYGMECYMLDDEMPVVSNPEGSETDGSFVVVDIETTGLSSHTDGITEIGAVKMKDGTITDTFHTFVNPHINIPEKITRLTGIDDSMVAGAPGAEEIIARFAAFAGSSCIAAHNASFDMGFIRHAAEKAGCKIKNPVLDTLQMSRKMFPDLKKHRLESVAAHLNVDTGTSHRALDDAKTACHILRICLKMLSDKNVTSLSEIDKELSSRTSYKTASVYHAVILVKNRTGLRNLYRIVSDSHLRYFYKKPRIPKQLMLAFREGLLLATACESGELYTAILENRSSAEIERIAGFYDLLEIQPLGNNRFLAETGRVKDVKALENINRRIVELGEKLGKPVIATGDVHFLNAWDEIFRRILMAGQGYSDADRQAPLYLRTTEEMLKEFEYLGKKKAYEVVVKNTVMVSEMIEEMPPVPEGTFPPKIDGSDEQLKKLAYERAVQIYGDPLPDIVSKRLKKELDSIIKNKFSVMYVIAWKLVSKSLKDGYLVGSRGSVGSSFVACMAGITEVNSLPAHYICSKCRHSEFITDGSCDCGFDLPDKACPDCGEKLGKDGYDIPFETFLGFDGDKEPDIDLNFSGEYQAAAHRYAEELFGKGRVYRAGTISTIASKTAYGFVRGYLDDKGTNVTSAEVDRLVDGCSGIKRTTGQHPGGIMIVPGDREIYDFCPIQRPADDTESDIVTTHFDYHSISGKLLKLDILGHDDPTVIRMLEDITDVDATGIPIGEKKTMELFSSTRPLGVSPEDIDSEAGTFGIPEFGTGFVRQMLVDTRPTRFSELIRISGLSHGTDVWLNNAQQLIRSKTAELSDVICTRDDIMLYLIHKGLPPAVSFRIMEDVRKGKGLKEEYEKIMKEKKLPRWYIDSCKKIKYMFPKAHAAAYVMMAFRIAWFKVHHPEAFYAAYYTVRADDFDAGLMAQGREKVQGRIEEIRRSRDSASEKMTQKEKNVLTILEVVNEMYARGIKFLPVDLYRSHSSRFIIESGSIRPPLNALAGLGLSAACSIVSARDKGEFLSVEDLAARAGISRTVTEILSKNKCLEGLPESNQLTLF